MINFYKVDQTSINGVLVGESPDESDLNTSPSASAEPEGTSNVPSEHLADPYTVVDDRGVNPACVGVNTEDMSELDGTATTVMTYQGFLQDSGCERGFSASDTTGITTLRSSLYRGLSRDSTVDRATSPFPQWSPPQSKIQPPSGKESVLSQTTKSSAFILQAEDGNGPGFETATVGANLDNNDYASTKWRMPIQLPPIHFPRNIPVVRKFRKRSSSR